MRIAIIGSGISGLTAAYELSKEGHEVVIFEKTGSIGGLGGYLSIGDNYIEKFYHHFFQSDKFIVNFAKELGILDKLKFHKVKTGIFINDRIFPFTTPKDVLLFSPLSLFDRLRCGFMAFLFKAIPFPIYFLDNISAEKVIKIISGNNVYEKIWGPLLEGKFSRYANYVPAMWLWGRIYDRSFKLGYLDGSLKILFDKLIDNIKRFNVLINLNYEILSIKTKGDKVMIKGKKDNFLFDKVILTTVSPIAARIAHDFPDDYKKKIESIDHLGAVCLIVELKHHLQSQYWLNICDKNSPVLVLVEHTNLIDKKFYNGKTIIYLANYIHRNEKGFSLTEKEINEEYIKIFKKINKSFDKSWIIKTYLSKTPYAQTIFKLGALKNRPNIDTPVKNIYLINIDQMYPHDRTVGQGIELGKKVSEMITIN